MLQVARDGGGIFAVQSESRIQTDINLQSSCLKEYIFHASNPIFTRGGNVLCTLKNALYYFLFTNDPDFHGLFLNCDWTWWDAENVSKSSIFNDRLFLGKRPK